jgi:hypothetical protein
MKKTILAFMLCASAHAQPWSPRRTFIDMWRMILPIPQVRIPGPGGLTASGSTGWTLVAHTTCSSVGGADCTTPAINCVGSSLIVITMAQNGGSVAVKDSLSNAYSYDLGSGYITIYDVISPTVSSGMTFSSNATGNPYPSLFVQCWAQSTPPTYDQHNSASGSGLTLQPGSVTATVNNSLIVTAISLGTDVSSLSISSPFGISDYQNGVAGDGYPGAMASYVQPTAAATTPTWTSGTSASSFYGLVVSFKP